MEGGLNSVRKVILTELFLEGGMVSVMNTPQEWLPKQDFHKSNTGEEEGHW